MITSKPYTPALAEHPDWSWRNLLPDFAAMLVVATGLVFLSRWHYLFYHVVAEFFAVGVAIIMFIVAWHTYRFSRNHFLMYLGCGYFWIAWLDVAHTLLYFGMPTALDEGNFTSQFWIGTRFLEALLLLSAPVFMQRPLVRGRTLALFGALAAFTATMILQGYFPDTYVDGRLTPFKVAAEYVIIAILIAAMVHLHRRRHLIDARIHHLMLVCLALTIGAELAFTFYVSMYGISNLIGHIFKLFSFWLIYVAIIRTTLADPFAVMARGSGTFNAIPDTTVLLDGAGRVRQANQTACRETGLAEAEMLGRHCHDLFHPRLTVREDCPLCLALRDGRPLSPLELEMGRGQEWRQFTLTPVLSDEYGGAAVQVSSDITRRKHDEAELMRSNTELRQYTEVVAHQLQEPLRSIRSYAQLLERRYHASIDAEGREFIGYISAGGKRLQHLLDGLLVYHQAASGTLPAQAIAGETVLDDALAALQERIDASRAVIEHTPLPRLRIKHNDLYLVLWHLLANALEYAGERPPRVCLTARKEGATCYVEVRDEGIGIDPRYHDKIFTLFTRLQNPHESPGIGLALCKKIVTRYGGRIWVESAPGEGAAFRFTLPAEEGLGHRVERSTSPAPPSKFPPHTPGSCGRKRTYPCWRR